MTLGIVLLVLGLLLFAFAGVAPVAYEGWRLRLVAWGLFFWLLANLVGGVHLLHG